MQIHELTKRQLDEVNIAGPGGLVNRAQTAYQAAKQPGALSSLVKSQQTAPPGSNMWQRAKTALASNPLTSSHALSRSPFAQAQAAQRTAAQGVQVKNNLQNQWLRWEQLIAQGQGVNILPPNEYRTNLEAWFKKYAVPKNYEADDFFDPTENDPQVVSAIRQTFDQITDSAQKQDPTGLDRAFTKLVQLIQSSTQVLTDKDEQAKAAARAQYKQNKQAQATGAAQPQTQPPQSQQQAPVVTPATITQTLQQFGLKPGTNLQNFIPQMVGAATVGSTGNANADNLLKALGLQVQ